MCVHLAPRWRRRSFGLTVVYTLLLLWTTDARALRDLGASPETPDAAGSGSNAVSGDVTGFSVESLTPVMTRAWNSGSFSDGSELNRDKSVTFGSLLMKQEEEGTGVASVGQYSPSAAAGQGVRMTPSASSFNVAMSKTRCSVKRRKDQKNEDTGHVQMSDEESKDVGAGTKADSKLYNSNGTIGDTGTTKEAPAIAPPLRPTSQALPPRHEALSAKAKEWSSSFSSSKTESTGQPQESSDSTDVLENSTKSAALTMSSSSSFDQTLVVVIIGVVGAIGAFLLVVSRKVLQETGDDDDSDDSSLF